MNADLKKLIRLQAVDLVIQELRATAEAFPAKSKALDDRLHAAQTGVEETRNANKANQARRKELESKVSDIETKISKYREQLMGVKTNEEYKAMVKEIEYSEASIRNEEDEILILMEQSESLAQNLKAAEATLVEDEQMVRAERSRLEALNSQDAKELEANVEERSTLGKEINDDILFRYERVRSARGGVGVARASDEECEVCNVRMRPQVFQEVRKNDSIIACDSCNRILYDPENLDHPFEVA